MFPELVKPINDLPENDPKSRMEMIINILAEDILKMDLTHIYADKIINGDQKHIFNLL